MASILSEEEAAEGTLGLAGWIGQSRGMAAAHRHLDLEINYVLAGTMTYLIGGRVVNLPPRRLCLLWGGVPHQMMRKRHVVEAIWVTIPLNVALRWGLPDRLIRPLLTSGFLAEAASRPGDLDLLHQWLADLPGRDEGCPSPARSDSEGVQIALLEIEARLRRFAQGIPHADASEAGLRGDGTAHPERGLAAVEAMAHFIARNFREAIGIEAIASEAHLHPNYAMTLFRRHTGMTLTQYLVLQRVAHAQRLLATSDVSIQEVAIESGFGSVSRFYEAFRQQTGMPPRRFRLQMERP